MARSLPNQLRRLSRWLGIALVGLFLLLAVAVSGLFFVLHQLDASWLKPRLIRTIQSAAGVELDWEKLEVSLSSGLSVAHLVVRSPAAFRELAPALAELGELEVRWSPLALQVRSLILNDLKVTLVQDDVLGGSWVFPAKTPSQAEPATAKASWPQLWADLLINKPLLAKALVSGVAVHFIRSAHGVAVDSTSLEGFAAALSTQKMPTSGWQWRLACGEPASPLPLVLTYQSHEQTAGTKHAGESATKNPSDKLARLPFVFDLVLKPDAAELTVDLSVAEQTWLPPLALHRLVHLGALAAFDKGRENLNVTIAQGEVGDGAGQVQVKLVLPTDDKLAPLVSSATAHFDLDRLAALAAPFNLPLSLHDGQVELQASRLRLSLPPMIEGDGGLSTTLHIKHASLAAQALNVEGLHWQGLIARSASGGLQGRLSAGLDRVEQRTSQQRITMSGCGFDLASDHLTFTAAGTPLIPDQLTANLNIKNIDLAQASLSIVLDQLELHQTTALRDGLPTALRTGIDAHLRVRSDKSRTLFDDDLKLTAEGSELALDLIDGAHSQGVFKLSMASAPVTFTLDASKKGDEVTVASDLVVPSLAPVGALFISGNPKINWTKLALHMHSQAALALSARTLAEKTSMELANLSLQTANGSLSARQLVLNTESSGSEARHHAEMTVALNGASMAGGPAADGKILNVADYNATGPTLVDDLTTTGILLPIITVHTNASFDHAQHQVQLAFNASLAKLGRLSTLLARDPAAGRVDLAPIALSLVGHANLSGVVAGFAKHGVPLISAHVYDDATGEASVDGKISHVNWFGPKQTLALDNVDLHLAGHLNEQLTLEAKGELDHLRLATGATEVVLANAVLDARGEMQRATGAGAASAILHLGSAQASSAAGYSMRDLSLALKLRREDDGVIDFDQVEFTNPDAGTKLTLHGALAQAELPQKLSISGALMQDLAHLWNKADDYRGSGELSLSFSVESSNLPALRVGAELDVVSAHLELPRARLKLDNLDGRIPLIVALGRTSKGYGPLRGGRPNPYAALRFADQHPLFSRSNFISLRGLTTPYVAIDSMAANLNVEQNMISLNQLELSLRGGHITGQCMIDYDDLRLRADIRANGLLSSYGEPFDGNAAFAFSLEQRSVDGHAEILRIGRRHLLDLLDFQDPDHSMSSFNKVRQGLALGYPDHVRLLFDHGFANALIVLGGLASFVKIDEMRGIPVGPLLDRYLATNDEDEEEVP